MQTRLLLPAAFIALGGVLGCLFASGHFAEITAQDAKAIAVPHPVDGSVLPFPPTPSASSAGLTMKDSTYPKRVEPTRRTSSSS